MLVVFVSGWAHDGIISAPVNGRQSIIGDLIATIGSRFHAGSSGDKLAIIGRVRVITTFMQRVALILPLLAVILTPACRTIVTPGRPLSRTGDEIIACGQLFHTSTRVITWLDPGGYDAYRVERKFVPAAKAGWPSCKRC